MANNVKLLMVSIGKPEIGKELVASRVDRGAHTNVANVVDLAVKTTAVAETFVAALKWKGCAGYAGYARLFLGGMNDAFWQFC